MPKRPAPIFCRQLERPDGTIEPLQLCAFEPKALQLKQAQCIQAYNATKGFLAHDAQLKHAVDSIYQEIAQRTGHQCSSTAPYLDQFDLPSIVFLFLCLNLERPRSLDLMPRMLNEYEPLRRGALSALVPTALVPQQNYWLDLFRSMMNDTGAAFFPQEAAQLQGQAVKVITRVLAQLRPHYERELNTLAEFLHVVDKNRLYPRTVYARYEQRTLKLSFQAAQTHQPLSLDLIAGPYAPALELNFAIPPAAKHDDIVAYFFEGFNASCLNNANNTLVCANKLPTRIFDCISLLFRCDD